jgi:hypothetical protein
VALPARTLSQTTGHWAGGADSRFPAAGLAGIVRNVCRTPGADETAPTFALETQRTPEQQRAYELLETITV